MQNVNFWSNLIFDILTGPDLQKVNFQPTSIFDIFDRSGPAKM